MEPTMTFPNKVGHLSDTLRSSVSDLADSIYRICQK